MAKTPLYAGFWIRFLAYIIDGILLSVVSSVLFSGPAYSDFGYLVTALYFGGFWMWKAATPGGMLLGLKVVSVDGSPLTAKTVLLRLVGCLLSTVALGIGFIWAGFDTQKQGWQDKIAKTYVVKHD